MITDYEDEKKFSRAALEKMPVVLEGQALTEWIAGDGQNIVVDVLKGDRFWIQYDRRHQLYRCAERKADEPSAFERAWRVAS